METTSTDMNWGVAGGSRRAEGQRHIPEEYWYLRENQRAKKPLRKPVAETGKVGVGSRTLQPWKLGGGLGSEFQRKGLVARAAEKG